MLSFMVRRISSWPFFILLLTAITVSGTIIFFFSHYLGNRIISHDLALQRFETFETELANEEYIRGYSHPFELCQLSNTVLRGSESISSTEGHSLRNTIILQTYSDQSCDGLRAAVSGDDHEPVILKTRYWWGNKTIYAVGLRFLSLVQFRQVVEVATYLAYGILLTALAMLTPRAALAAVPVAIFGVFCSGAKYFTDVSNGVPYLWAVLAAAILSLLMKLRLGRFGPPAIVKNTGDVTVFFCFVAGMISSYLFFYDGHVSYVIALFGLVAWLGSPDQSTRDRAKRAALFVVFYIAGFVACFMLGQIVKEIAIQIAYNFRFSAFRSLYSTDTINGPLPLMDGWSLFWTIGMGRIATGEALSFLSLAVLVIAVSLAIVRGRRGHWDLFWDILFVLVLTGVVCLSLLVPNDILGRSSRYLFIIYGLVWSCLVLAIMKLGWRLRATIVGFVVVSIFGWGWASSNRVEGIILAYERLEDNNLIIHDHFKVYLDEELSSLVYVRDECSYEDVVPQIWLVHTIELGGNNREPQYDIRRLWFEDYGMRFEGKCVAIVPLQPEYDIELIRTGQHNYVSVDNIWISSYAGRISSHSAEYDSIVGDEPLFHDVYDVYLGKDYDSLIYVKERCRLQDAELAFFLHVFPVSEEDLPEHRRQLGFINVGFWFGTNGVFSDGRCVTTVDLPDYDIAAIQTGQYVSHEDQHVNTWSQNSFSFGRISSHSAEYDSIVGDEPLFHDVYDVYLGKDYDSLIYVKERCRLQDAELAFFLHVFPVSEEDLPEHRRQLGFINVGFWFGTNGVFSDGRCVTTVDLPDYDIAAIQTGQYVSHEDLYVNTWSRAIDLQR